MVDRLDVGRIARRAFLGAVAGGLTAGAVQSTDATTRRTRTLAAGTDQETTVHVTESDAPGPTALVVGGVHGDETAGYRAAADVAEWTPETGTLVVLPRANASAVAAGTREGPTGDLNRQFPLREPPRTRLAEEIWGLVEEFDPDLVVDLHESRALYERSWGVGQSIGYAPVTNLDDAVGAAIDAVNVEVLHDDWTFRRRPLPRPDEEPTGVFVQRCAYERGIPSYIVETYRGIDLRKRVHWQTDVVRELLAARRDAYGEWDRRDGTGDHRLELTGLGPTTEYQFRTTGEVTDRIAAESHDSVFDNRAYGLTKGASDVYRFTGVIADFAITEGREANLVVELDGRQRSVAELNGDREDRSDDWRRIEFRGTGPRVRYAFGATEALRATETLDDDDTVEGTRADGAVQGGIDRYLFRGDLVGFEIVAGNPEDVRIVVDGDLRTAAALREESADRSFGGSEGPGEREMAVVGTGNRTDYEFTVAGGVEPLDNVETSDAVGDRSVAGSVRWLSDNFRITGDVTSFAVAGGDPGIEVWIDGSRYAPADFPDATSDDRSSGGGGSDGDDETDADGGTDGDTGDETPTDDPDNADGGSDGSDGDAEHGMAVVGTGEPTEYAFAVTGDLRAGDNLETVDRLEGAAAEGAVRWLSDHYTYTGEIAHFDVVSGDPGIEIWIDRERHAPTDFPDAGSDGGGNAGGDPTDDGSTDGSDAPNDDTGGSADGDGSEGGNGDPDELDREISVVGTGSRTDYEFAVSGSIDPLDNVEANDAVGDRSVAGRVRWLSDNFRFSGELTSFAVADSDPGIEIWIDGSRYAPTDFPDGTEVATVGSRELRIDGPAGTEFEFDASGGVRWADGAGAASATDGTAAWGRLEDGETALRFSGAVERFAAPAGDAADLRLSLDGTPIFPEELTR